MNINLILRQLNSAIKNMLARGKLLALNTEDTSGASPVPLKVPMAKVGLFSAEIYDGIEYPQDFGFKSSPPLGSETLTIHFGGNRNHASMIRAFDRNIMPTELEPGETVLYNAFGLTVKLNVDSEIVINKSEQTITISIDDETGDLTLSSTANIVLDVPEVNITGDLVVDGTINGTVIPPP